MRAPVAVLAAIVPLAVLAALGATALMPSGCDSNSGSEPPTEGWVAVSEDLPGALLGIWGTAVDDVWVVGAQDGEGAQVRHFDGAAWTRLDDGGAPGDLWWVFGRPTDAAVYVSGDEGVVLRLPVDAEGMPTGDAPTRMDVPTEGTVFGLWGTPSGPLWAVGRTGAGSGAVGGVWTWDGQAWTAVPLPAEVADTPVWNKVWGTADDDVWVCGGAARVLHWDGASWDVVADGGFHAFTTIAGTSDGAQVTAVGGALEAVMLQGSATGGLEDVTPGPPAPRRMTGVDYADDDATAWAVGDGMATLRWEAAGGGAWRDGGLEVDGVTNVELHAVWVAPDGTAWAVGGALATPPRTEGTLVWHGLAGEPAGF